MFRTSRTGPVSSTCLPALFGLTAFFLAGALAQAQTCGNLLSVGPVISPISGSKVVVGQTISIQRLSASSAAGNCVFRNGVAFYAHPNGDVYPAMQNLSLDPGDTVSCPVGGAVTCLPFPDSYVVNAADINRTLPIVMPPRGQFPGDTVTANGSAGRIKFFGAGNVDGFDPDDPTQPTGFGQGGSEQFLIVVNPAISITKACVNDPCTPYGQPITFQGTIKNETPVGEAVTLVNIAVIDDPAATIIFNGTTALGHAFDTAGNNLLRPGDSVGYTGSYSPPNQGGDSLCGPFRDVITVTANAAGVYLTPQVTSSAEATCEVCPPEPQVTLTKTCAPATVNFDAGSFKVYANISNPGTVDLQNVVITDHITYADGTTEEVVINYGTLLAGASDTIEITISFDECGPISDFLTVVAEGPCETIAEATSNTCTTEVTANPALSIDKVCTPTEVTYGAASYDVTITVQNVGNVALKDVLISDAAAGVNTTVDLAAGATHVIQATVPIPSGNCGEVQNTATASATHACGNPRVSDTCTIDIVGRPSLAIVKTCPDSVAFGATSFEATITVSNDGNVPLTGVVVTDSLLPAPGIVGTVDLAVNAFAEFTVTIPVPADSCGDIVNTATASATHPCGPAEASDSCTVDILCEPQICVTKEIACMPESADCATAAGYDKTATGVEGAAFCYKITVRNCGQVPLLNVEVVDSLIDVAGKLTTTEFPVGYSETFYVHTSFLEAGTYPNTVTATGDWDDGNAETTEEPVTDTDSAEAIVVPIGVECDIEVVGTVQPPVGGCEATLSESGPVQFTLTIRNTGEADLLVSITGVPALYDCDELTAIEVPASVRIPVDEEYVLTGCTTVSCPEGAEYAVTVQGTAVASDAVPCVYDSEGNAVQTQPSTCRACVNCRQEGLFCRTTGGGTLIEGTVDELSEGCVDVETTLHPLLSTLGQILNKVTHGGQLGAPYAAASCPENVSQLGNPCIKGQWQHVRHYQGKGNPRDVVSGFHAGGPGKGTFDTLMCACLPCCEDPQGVNQPNGKFNGWENKGYCNPLDHKVCGPAPRPAPANALIWSGLGQMNQASDTGNKPAEYVVIRVYIEDRSEPGGNHPKGAVLPSDIYSFQMWRTGVLVSKKPDYSTIAQPLRLAVAQDSCNFLEALKSGLLPIGSLPSAVVGGATASVNDQGPLHDGNRQIHPTTSATCP